ncbi:MAG: hypothetical protein ACI8UO_005708 [Verrucomicrobiales bacterium]|jgi:hypothetical protein
MNRFTFFHSSAIAAVMKIQLMTAVAALWSCHVAWAEDRSVEWALDNNIT